MPELKKFEYKKPDGKVSKRTVWVLNNPSDSYFGLDLTEFSEEEQEFYKMELERIQAIVDNEISELSLSSCYRRFKKDRVL